MSALAESAAAPLTGLAAPEVFASTLQAAAGLPAWWLDLKKAAWNQFNALPYPKRTDENWRFATLTGLKLDACGFTRPATPPLPPAAPAFTHSASLTFANNVLVGREPLPPELARLGVLFCPLEEALLRHGDLFRAHFQKHPVNLGSEKFVSLHTALTLGGGFLHVPKGVELPAPLVITHLAHGPGAAVFPHTLVVAEDHARATVVEFFLGAGGAPGPQFAAGQNDLYAGPGAQLTYLAAQDWSRDTLSFQFNSIAAQRDARILTLNLHLGGRQARHESHSRLQGPGAHTEMLALTLARGAQEFDQRTLQVHQAPHTSSNLLYKNALLDAAHTIFSGLIVVDPDAQKTDAYQSNRNLALSPDCEANSLPGLEIQANDVRCTHGATTSRVDPEQLYYLESRGIRPAVASELLVFGFFEEILSQLENDQLHDLFRELIQAKFKK